MTSEEVDKSIKALFDHQNQLTADISRLEVSIEELKENVSVIGNSVNVLTKDVQDLTASVANMAFQADTDRAHMQTAYTVLNSRMDRFEKQAEEDRAAIRQTVERIEKQAELDRQEMRNSIERLAEIMGSTIRRVGVIEDKVQ